MDEATRGEVPPADDASIARTVDLQAEDSETVRAPAMQVRYVGGAAPVPPRLGRKGQDWAGPTLTSPDLSESGYFVDAEVRPRSRRMRWWLAAAVAAIVVAAAAVVLLQFRSDQSPPTETVRQYFADLATGDTDAAMALVEDAGSYTAAANPLLSSQALAKPDDRPGEVTIAKSVRTTVDGGRSGTAVTVGYAIDGTQVQQTIIVAASTASASHPYVLKAPFITVAVTSAKGRAVKVNGIPYPDGASQVLAFPGAYRASVAGNQLVAAATARATYDSASGAVKAEIWLPAPSIAPGASDAVQSAVNRALDSCAASTSPTPANCPFRYSDSSATMKWKISAYPKVKAKVSRDGTVTFDDGGHAATLHYDATTSDFFGLFSHTSTGDLSVDVAGTAALSGGDVAVTFAK